MRPNLDVYYLRLAHLAASRAGCPKRSVGCVITDHQNRIIATGYNSPPRDLPTCFEVPCGGTDPEGEGVCVSAHAEISALISCRDIQSAKTIYISCSPCVSCMQAIMCTPIERIVFSEYHKTWGQSRKIWTGKTTFIDKEEL